MKTRSQCMDACVCCKLKKQKGTKKRFSLTEKGLLPSCPACHQKNVAGHCWEQDSELKHMIQQASTYKYARISIHTNHLKYNSPEEEEM